MPAEPRSRLARGRLPAILRAAALATLLACAVAIVPGGPPAPEGAAVAAGPSPDGGDERRAWGLAPAPEPTTDVDDFDQPSEPAPPIEPAAPIEPAPRFDPPRGLRVDRDVRYRGPYGPTLDVHHPAGPRAGRAPAVLVVHGGGWRGGDKSAVSQMARSLAEAGFVAVNVNYTLATPWRAGFPIQLDELRSAIRWIRARAGELRVDPARIGAMGSSAGAHLVSLLATSGRGPLTAGTRVRAVATWSAPFDLAPARMPRLRAHVSGFVGCYSCRRRRMVASPITHVTRDDPPMMIVNSRREMIHASQARRMSNRLRAAGVPRRLRLLSGAVHAPRYAPTVRRPTIAFLDRWLRR